MEQKNENNDQFRTIEEIMRSREKAAKEAAQEVDRMEKAERMETTEQHAMAMKGNILDSAIKKQQFISEIKNGLGEQIKSKPNEIKVVKKKRSFKDILRFIFNKF